MELSINKNGGLFMKKLLSLVMVVLVGFLSCSVRGYEVNYLPDGGRKITYTYGELQQLGEKHKQLLAEIVNDISDKEKSYSNIKVVSNVSSVLCMVVGAIMCINKMCGDVKDGDVIPGIALCALGVVGLLGVPMGLERQVNSLRNEQYAIEERVSVIDLTKHEIDRYVANGFGNRAEVTGDFSYSMYVDKNGYVYQVERVGRGVSYTKIPLKTKYKITW